MDGILLVDKPKGWTSFDVVARVRNVLRTGSQSSVISRQSVQITGHRSQATPSPKLKVGHTGTLDPLATGLLVLLIGSDTKRAPEYSKLDKTYEITMRLGQTSTTGDEEGEKKVVSSQEPVIGQVEEVLKGFIGESMQMPPAYSAIKVNGQRAYKLARAGKTPELQERPINIYKIELKKYKYPYVEFTARVSSGTYIRSLVEDIGNALGSGAYMSDLRRTSVGSFRVNNAVSVDSLNANPVQLYNSAG